MKNVLRLLVFAALVTVFALPAYAQDAAAAQTPAADPCTADADAKAALYKKFTDNYRGTAEQQKVAYEAGKEYISKYGNCAGDAAIVTYIKTKFIDKYEEATLVFNCQKAANDTPAQAFEACKAWIAAKPDDLRPHLALVGAGIKAYTSKDNSLNARAAAEARTALQMIESGKTTDVWAPFSNQQDAPAGLRYYIAAWSLESNPDESATQLLKVAQSNSAVAKEPATFQLLGASIYNGDVTKLANQYKGQCEGKDATPECDILLNKINYALDRVIDAYARAVALSNTNPKYAATATALRPVLSTLYKQRHEGQDTELNSFIANVLSKPLPLPGQEPPLPTPPATGTTGDGVKTTPTGTATTTPAVGTTPAKPASTTTTPPATKPAPPAQKPPVSKSAPAKSGGVAGKGNKR
jgi:hypothetical protein